MMGRKPFCSPARQRHSRSCSHTEHVVLLWNQSFPLRFCFQTTETITACARAGNRWGNILGLFTLLCSKCWHAEEQFIVQLYMIYICFLLAQVTYSRLFLTNSLKTAGFTLSEGNTGYICEPTFLGALGKLWILPLFPVVASAAFSLQCRNKGLLCSENNLVKVVEIKVYH